MSNFFRGALNLIQGGAEGVLDGETHPLVGKELLIGDTKLRVRSVIAEGGFAIVFSAQDQAGRQYALKQQIANDKDALNALSNEIAVMEELRGHPNIVGYFNTAKSRASNGGTEFMILMELCTGGSVIDLLKLGPLNLTQVLRIFYAACRAVKHMHCREKPITHRDIKVENLLFNGQGVVKLCDFGSSTRARFHPDDSWSPIQRITLIEEMQRNTTPMYRAPEISDEYMNMPVGPQQDVWALGCVLFYLCYRVHPFEDSAKLRIINAKYTIPADDTVFTMFIPLIQSCLRPNPVERPTIADLVERTEALAAAMDVKPADAVPGVAATLASQPSQDISAERNAPPRPARPEGADVSQQASAVFGALKGQGMNLFKQIKDRSAAVVQTVQATYGSGPDIVWISSRMVLAPLAELVPEALAAQAEETIRNFATGHSRPFLMVNFSNRRLRCEYPSAPLENMLPQVVPGPPATVNYLLKMCRSMTQFLRQHPNGFVVLYGLMQHCALLSSALMIYNRLLPRSMNSLELVTARRKAVTQLPPSFHRALDLFTKIVSTDPSAIYGVVHNYPVYMLGISMEPSPQFNVNKTGCRPFAEVYCGGNKLWSTYKDYDQLRAFEVPDRRAEIPLDKVPVGDDVTIVVYHARWSKMQNKMQQFFMFSFGFHANFCDVRKKELVFHIGDVDIKDSERSNFPEGFKVILKLQIDNADRGFKSTGTSPPEFLGYQPDTVSSNYLVDGMQEYEQISVEFGGAGSPKQRTEVPRPERQTRNEPQQQQTADFFSTLEWGQGGGAAATAPPPVAAAKEVNLFDIHEETGPARPAPPAHRPQTVGGRMTAEDYEREAGIRVGREEPDEDLSQFQFDCDKPMANNETPILGGGPSPVSTGSRPADIDLLGLGEMSITNSQSSKPIHQMSDPFGDIFGAAPSHPVPSAASNPSMDLFGDFAAPTPATAAMHRNVSAPTLPQNSSTAFDPFAEFMNTTTHSNPASKPASGGSSAATTPKPSRPNYSRSAFDAFNSPAAGAKPKVAADAFGDLLSGQGFSATSFASGPKTMADLQRTEEVKTMDPVQIKIHDWTKGKEKNIRALIGSLNEVLWEGADNWQQPSMGDLLQPAKLKKAYFKACLVVHPDKQTGKPHEKLAKAIFTELNQAWTAENPS